MKANELRIGNLVSDIHAGKNFFALVKKLTDTRCYYGDFHSGYNDLKPIPITEEWLLRGGFENNHSSVNFKTFYNNGFDYRIELYSDGKVFFDELREIQYVHQLQNLYFALTGDELEFKP